MRLLKWFFCLLVFLQIQNAHSLYAQNDGASDQKVRYTISVLEDKKGEFNIQDISTQPFKPLEGHTPNYNLTSSVYWFKIKIQNPTDEKKFLLKIHNATLTSTSFYTFKNNQVQEQTLNNTTPYSQRKINSQYPLFNITIPVDSPAIYYLRTSSINVLDLPISIENNAVMADDLIRNEFYFGIYAGLIMVMFLYNIFIFLTVKDENYLYYVLYILVVGLTQACLKGYAAKYLWPDNAWLILEAPHIITAFSGIFSILFAFNFLQARRRALWAFYILSATIVVYVLSISAYLAGFYMLAQEILQVNTGIVSIVILLCGFYVYKKGYKPALFFNVSWSFFLGGVIIYILKDVGIFPFNVFTSNSILIGSGLEVTFLSFALADKINIYKKEKEISQEETLKALQENERITREQNVILETKVNERTLELTVSNEGLNKALIDLKEAESQLVESEKMASLGQLTAGIAHEINNPINFITANVNPLKRDVDVLLDTINMIETVGLSASSTENKQKQIADYKEEVDFDYLKTEIEHLINGISDGASRTAEIVKGLRVFSRLDEDDRKKANINEGIDSTLVIVNNLFNNHIKVIKNYGDLPAIDCYPGKLNQVFLNIISNAIYAINKQRGETKDGRLIISTEIREDQVVITFEDNGTGMDENTRKKIFEPFFTTKDVGDGTGLGMSIVYNTIQRHEGKIFVNSTPGIGTEFIIELPIHKTLDN